MTKRIAEIPLATLERVQIYINTARKTLEAVKAETGADYLLNGGLYNMAQWRAVCHLKANGYVYAEDPWQYRGYAWDTGPDISMELIPAAGKRSYLCCVALLRDGKAMALDYPAGLGGARQRSAMGLMGDKLCLYCTDGAVTPEGLRAELLAAGWEGAVMLDGGGSSQCDFAGQRITSARVVHNLILVYLKKEDKPVDKKYTVCLDPGHGPDTVNGSPDGSYKEREFAWDMYTRLWPLLEQQGIGVVCTRRQDSKPSLTERANVSNRAGADLFVSLHSNAEGGTGWGTARGLLVYTSAAGDTAARNVAAKAILERMREAGVAISGGGVLHQIEYTVLAKTTAPAVLIEYGFHTSRADVALLRDSAYRDKLAEATARGVCDFLGVAWIVGAGGDAVDTPPASWATEAWEKATGAGILDGTRPTDNLTRQELAVVLDRLGLIN